MSQFKADYDKAIEQLTGPGGPFETAAEVVGGVSYKNVIVSAPVTMKEVWAQAAPHGDKEFLIYEGERWTYTQLLQQAASFGHQLVHEYGVKKGDRVAIAMRNYPEWMTAYIAITSIGAVAVTLNSWGQAQELEYGLTDADVRVVFCDQPRLDLIADKLVGLDIKAIVARPDIGSQPDNTVSVADLIAGQEGVTMPQVDICPEDNAMMMYTSGTTGQPKGALSTHWALCQAIANFEAIAMAMAMINPEAMEAMFSTGFEPAQMLAVPLFHVSGCHAVFLTAFKAGRKVVMMYKWNVENALKLVESERVTFFSAAPSMLLQILESPLLERCDVSSLFSLGGGGSATPPKVSRLIQQRFPSGYPGTGWGLTETNAIGTSFTGKPFTQKPGSAGFKHPGAEIEARDDDGNVLPAGIAGELWIKTPSMVKEYWHRPEANAADFKEGWFNSGDLGYFDSEGYLFMSGRAKDMIIRGGENIYPAEIEAVISDHPRVEEVAVFGVEDQQLGEVVAIAVVARGGETLSGDDIKAYAAERLARFKVPEYVWLLDKPLPRNDTGKVLKKDLKVEYASLH
jgi:acyl-CoA synthetase (AMP-forming)/AMP-acid ligase II